MNGREERESFTRGGQERRERGGTKNTRIKGDKDTHGRERKRESVGDSRE